MTFWISFRVLGQVTGKNAERELFVPERGFSSERRVTIFTFGFFVVVVVVLFILAHLLVSG